MKEQQQPQADQLKAKMLEEALQDVLHSPDEPGEAAEHLKTLRQAAQVSAALQQLQLYSSNDNQQPKSAEAGAARFTGAASGLLGVSSADLLAEALPSQARRQAAMEAVMPLVEAQLQRRCRLLGAASGYGTDDYTGLPDHIRQLQNTAAASQAAQAEAWEISLEQAQQGVAVLAESARLIAGILREHKLTGQKEADEAQAALLHSEFTWLVEKLGLVELQLKDQTYTPAVVAALRKVAVEVNRTTAETEAQLKQATMRLQQYQSLGPSFVEVAQQHAAVMQAIEEAEYELREVEQFAQLAAVTG